MARPGPPLKEIDYQKLEVMCSFLCTGEECASVLGIDYDTLNRALARDGHGGFTDFLKKHAGKAKMSLRRAQFRAAIEDKNIAMQIWLGKQYLGQREPEKETPDEDVVDILRKLLTEKQG